MAGRRAGSARDAAGHRRTLSGTELASKRPAPLPIAPSRGFPPVLPPHARVLVLGSLPGVASITAGRYYAHPRNLFWDFMGELFGAGPTLDYDERLARLGAAGVALWDVLAEGERPGSLDASIDLATAAHNDIDALLRTAPGIGCIACNGALAATLFRRHIVPTLGAAQRQIPLLALPSTSPAHASMTRAAKLDRWRALQQAAAAPR